MDGGREGGKVLEDDINGGAVYGEELQNPDICSIEALT